MNKTMLIGRLTDTPELKETPTNKKFARFNLAVNRKFKNTDGEKQADFISIIAWGKLAEFLTSYARKGSQISVEGEIRTNNYLDKEQKKRYSMEVLCTSFELLESRAAQALRENNYDTGDLILDEEDIPF